MESFYTDPKYLVQVGDSFADKANVGCNALKKGLRR